MKIKDLKCPAWLEHGILTLDDGTYINLADVYGVMADLCEYAESSTLESDELPACVSEGVRLLDAFS